MAIKIKDKIKNLNIVIGCPIGCRYCYARNNCRRFHMTDDFSVPRFFERKLRLFDTEKPQVFLLTGMSDLAFWEEEWVKKVLDKAAETPQNTYLFLTKRPERLNIDTRLDNLWFGVTVTCAAERGRILSQRKRKGEALSRDVRAAFGRGGGGRPARHRLGGDRHGDGQLQGQGIYEKELGGRAFGAGAGVGHTRIHEGGPGGHCARRGDDTTIS